MVSSFFMPIHSHFIFIEWLEFKERRKMYMSQCKVIAVANQKLREKARKRIYTNVSRSIEVI